jgi:hypothetical protein
VPIASSRRASLMTCPADGRPRFRASSSARAAVR